MLTRKTEDGQRKVIGRRDPGQRETPEFGKMVARMLRSYGKRVADADEVDLKQMLDMRAELDAAIIAAVHGQRTKWERSWGYIAEGAGMTRQAAQQRWGKAVNEYAAKLAESNEPPTAEPEPRKRVAARCLDCDAEATQSAPGRPFAMHHADDCPNRTGINQLSDLLSLD